MVALFFIIILHLCSYQVSTTSSCIEEEREALLKLKASFSDSSKRLASWEGIDCCSWDGVGCNQSNGHVVKLDLRNYDEYNFHSHLVINGIDSSLFELKYLNYLDLSTNCFNFTQIPDYFSSMLELRYLNLSCTCFYGEIPPSLGNLTKLLVLDFKINEYLDGPSYFETTQLFIDDGGWISSLSSSLEYLDLSGVKLKSNLNLVQVLNKLPSLLSLKLRRCDIQNTQSYIYPPLNSSFISKLQHLDLAYNRFGGPIPNFFQNMTSLRFLYLLDNRFNSSIPLWFGNLRNFVALSLGSNLFTSVEGGLFSIIRNNCHLKQLDLSNNQFLRGDDVFGSHGNLSASCKDYDLELLDLRNITSGIYPIPNWLGQLKNLKFLYLNNNSLHGPIPASLGNLSNLEYLDISYNLLSGGIPTSFGKLSNLRTLTLRDNLLSGIPKSFGQLQSLVDLDLSENALEGIVSEVHFANLSQLKYLRMTENSLLSFEMKHNWIPPFQLKYFFVGSTKGFGSTEFPGWLETQQEMLELDLSNTSISGHIPTWLSPKSMSILDLSYNQISGSLPESIGDQMPNLVGLFISNTKINGSLPLSLCKLHPLFLILSDNELSGTIPNCLLDNQYLNHLDLSSNKLSGVFPSSLTNLFQLEVLRLGNNKLEGEPLVGMRSWVRLCIVDLEGNKFSGIVPSWLGETHGDLQILNLRGNMFNGTIPSTLWLLPHLQILILADNKLVGNIPPNVGNFCAISRPIHLQLLCESTDSYKRCHVNYVRLAMKSSNLNYSYLRLYSMVNIDFSNNNLYGEIPSGITAIKGLVGLNLSRNNLLGTIPVEIAKAESLESLDLSFNQLSGSIPNNMSGLNSLGTLKLSNNNLSGRIPREGHLSTFNDASSFAGNTFLCGDPLSVKCPNENSGKPPGEIDNFDDYGSHEEGDKYEKMWFYIIIMLGYALGFWGVVGALILKRSWRHAYFHFMDEMKDKICVATLVNMTRLKQQIPSVKS
ncbi:probable leucine-rich repeat receptor-like protein kinase At2g33170 [Momordica charantia]|uniref:Probable leucine-rich repeat receptor-like protein kinase At2g33170 n=1 Tax=Momordica charantia TaxID=3673 RepID=A0A6J1DRZ9_MOMCH|nr:probable leucine-rich repeat receptor-like protein kinase At2g33170 [Momordica charantia]